MSSIDHHKMETRNENSFADWLICGLIDVTDKTRRAATGSVEA